MLGDIDEVLYRHEEIARRVAELGAEIARDFDRSVEHPEEIVLIPVMTGALVFTADIMRHLPQKMRIEIISVSSYPGRSMTSKGASMRGDLPADFAGRHLLVIDDILDSGNTLGLVQGILRERRPASLRTCVMLRKRTQRACPVEVDYVGFEIDDVFVVGYGLDYDDYYRNLPDIVTLREEVL